MSGTLTTGFRRRMLDHVFRATALGFNQIDVALTRKVPSANAAVSQLDEPAGMSYARQRVNLDAARWSFTVTGEMGVAVDTYFPTATGNWGVMTGWAWISVEGSPIVLAAGILGQPYRTLTGTRLYIPAGMMSAALYD